MIWFVVLAALVAGYVIGRVQPYTRLADWANWQLRFHIDRWQSSRPRQAVLFTLLLITDSARTIHAWRHRNESN
ncbi:hypothetical protein ABT215_11135 [Streptomyces sp900105755]|uniref:hypothetical protein n=1 Tax=Streptomyces sp. 900105755 TaxID=3154389 RepID=UPI00331ACF3B